MVSQSIRVNFIPSGVQDRLHASQYDTGERVFSFLCFYGSSLYEIPSGAIVTINGQKQGGYAFVLPCTYDGSVVTCDCTQTMTDVAGNVECELQVNVNGETVQSGNFILVVEPSAIDSSVIPSSDYEAIAQMVTEAAGAAEDAQTAAQEAEQAAASIPDPNTLMKYADLTTGTGVTQANTKGVDATLLNQSNANALINRSQLQTSGTVATAGQYPLDAVEKNPNVSGSLGAQIADLANNVDSLADGSKAFTNVRLEDKTTDSSYSKVYDTNSGNVGIMTPGNGFPNVLSQAGYYLEKSGLISMQTRTRSNTSEDFGAWSSYGWFYPIYSKVVTGTTDANGFITLNLSKTEYIPIVANAYATAYDRCVEFSAGVSSWWGRVTYRGTAEASKSVTFTVWYFRIA